MEILQLISNKLRNSRVVLLKFALGLEERLLYKIYVNYNNKLQRKLANLNFKMNDDLIEVLLLAINCVIRTQF